MLLLLLLLRLLAQSPPPCETHQPRSIAITWILPPDSGRMFRMKLATLLVFLAVAKLAVTIALVTIAFRVPGGQVSGRSWRGWAAGKRGYLVGFSDGIMLPLSADSADNDARPPAGLCVKAPGCLKNHFGRSTYGVIMEGLDDLYRDPANVQISVPHAMAYFQELNGASPENLAEQLASLRKISADHVDKQ